jgi:hypothetical protein
MPGDQLVVPNESLYGEAIAAGCGPGAALAIHLAAVAVVAVLASLVWRGRASGEVKAAVLSAGALLATPYLPVYDLTLLVVPAAFLVRHGLTGGFLPGDRLALLVGLLGLEAVLALQALDGPLIGPVVALIPFALALRHGFATPRPDREASSGEWQRHSEA